MARGPDIPSAPSYSTASGLQRFSDIVTTNSSFSGGISMATTNAGSGPNIDSDSRREVRLDGNRFAQPQDVHLRHNHASGGSANMTQSLKDALAASDLPADAQSPSVDSSQSSAIDSLISFISLANPEGLFHFFPKLPYELRQKIWKYALVLEGRIVFIEQKAMNKTIRDWEEDTNLNFPTWLQKKGFGDMIPSDLRTNLKNRSSRKHTSYKDFPLQGLSCISAAPAIMLVCPESHRVGEKFYKRSFSGRYYHPETYFSFELDTLHISFENFLGYNRNHHSGLVTPVSGTHVNQWNAFVHELSGDLKKVKRLVITHDAGEISMGEYLKIFHVFTGLEQLYVNDKIYWEAGLSEEGLLTCCLAEPTMVKATMAEFEFYEETLEGATLVAASNPNDSVDSPRRRSWPPVSGHHLNFSQTTLFHLHASDSHKWAIPKCSPVSVLPVKVEERLKEEEEKLLALLWSNVPELLDIRMDMEVLKQKGKQPLRQTKYRSTMKIWHQKNRDVVKARREAITEYKRSEMAI